MNAKRWTILTALFALAQSAQQATALGTAFSYQGSLTENGNAATGNYDMQFYLRDAVSGGNPVGTTNTLAPVSASNGLFTVVLDFGTGIFTGNALWLEIGVRTNGSVSPYSTLSPRQQLTPSPYAIMANNASNLLGSLPAAQLSGTIQSGQLSGAYGGSVAFSNAANTFSGNFIGSGSALSGLNASQLTSGAVPAAALSNAWQVGGNTGTTPGTQFLGTTDYQPLELKVANSRALRIEPANLAPNLIGGGSDNSAALGSVGATIAGGRGNYASGESSVIAGGELNTNSSLSSIGGGFGNSILSGSYNVIAGGVQNSIQGFQSIIGGGTQNSIQGSQSIIGGGGSNTNVADSAAIGGGDFNNIQSGAQYATVGGGYNCTIQTNASSATIGGGSYNLIQSSAQSATIGGGVHCQIQENAQESTIAGGNNNFVQPNAQYATVGGGSGNSSAGIAATVPGGELNQATGRDSFAAGQRARAYHDGAFVWSDYSNPSNLFASTGPNQFLIRARPGSASAQTIRKVPCTLRGQLLPTAGTSRPAVSRLVAE